MPVTWGAQGWEFSKGEGVPQSRLEPQRQGTGLQRVLTEAQEKQRRRVNCQVRQVVSWAWPQAGPSAGVSPWSHPGWCPQGLGLGLGWALALLSAVSLALALVPAADPQDASKVSLTPSATPTHGADRAGHAKQRDWARLPVGTPA